MANEFIARKGIVSLGNVTVTGSLTATNGFTGSFSGSTSAPGLTTQVTYNNDGVLSADSGFVYSGSRVGIGTTIPSAPLHISSSTAGNLFLVSSPSSSNVLSVSGSGTTVLQASTISTSQANALEIKSYSGITVIQFRNNG